MCGTEAEAGRGGTLGLGLQRANFFRGALAAAGARPSNQKNKKECKKIKKNLLLCARGAADRGLGQALDRVAVLRQVHDRHARDLCFVEGIGGWREAGASQVSGDERAPKEQNAKRKKTSRCGSEIVHHIVFR